MPLLRFFLAFLYADLDAIGWDPTMKHLEDADVNGLPQYDIDVHGSSDGKKRSYRTRRLISGSGAQTMRSRGTRVWEVVPLIDGVESGVPVILKDAWVDAELQREGFTLEELKAGCSADYQDAFLTIVTHGDVCLGIAETGEGIHDLTKAALLPRGIYASADVGPVVDATVRRTSWNFRRKIHYRIVFQEVCTALVEQTSILKILRILISALYGECYRRYSAYVDTQLYSARGGAPCRVGTLRHQYRQHHGRFGRTNKIG